MIVRTYQCADCDTVFEATLDSGNDPDPGCPICEKPLEWRPGMFAIGTSKGKSIDVAQKIIEEDFGVTNFRDDTREGEIAAMPETQTKAETDAMAALKDEMKAQAASIETTNPQVQASIKSFFGGGASSIMPAIDVGATLAAAKQGPYGVTPTNNPMSYLQRGIKAGVLPNNLRIVAKG